MAVHFAIHQNFNKMCTLCGPSPRSSLIPERMDAAAARERAHQGAHRDFQAHRDNGAAALRSYTAHKNVCVYTDLGAPHSAQRSHLASVRYVHCRHAH